MGSRAVGPRALAKGVRASPRTQNDTRTNHSCPPAAVPFRHAWTHALLLPARSDAEPALRLLPALCCRSHCAWGEDTCSVADWIDFAFLLIFATEMVLKMTALGLCGHKSSYLHSGWNWIDMLVVLTGFVTLVFSAFPVVGTFRLVRMIRPLRSIQRIRGLRVLVQCIIVALPQICNVGIFLVFILTIFALFGVAFFGLQMRHSCHQWVDDAWVSTGEMCDPACKWNMDLMVSSGCESLGHDTIGNYSFPFDWRWSYTCRPGFQCRCTESHRSSAACTFKDNPNYGATSFDSYPWAMVTLFTAITLEGWTDVMYYLMDGCSVFVIPYFIILVFFGVRRRPPSPTRSLRPTPASPHPRCPPFASLERRRLSSSTSSSQCSGRNTIQQTRLSRIMARRMPRQRRCAI